MSLKVENLGKNMAELTITVSAEEFDKALTESFQKNKSKFNIPGFRKGKATRGMVEKFYGPGTLYEDAIDIIFNKTYPDAVKESGLNVVSKPEIDIKEMAKGKEFVYSAKVAVKPEVTLGEYKGVEVKRADEEVNDEDISEALKKEQEKNSRLITIDDRPVENGDNTLIDFDGKVDGVRFEGGRAEDYPLVIGSHSFIEGFEEQVIGHSLGEEFDINVVFPEKYHAKELAGKPAVFTVKIKEIKKKELPELDDEFAGEVSEFETLDEYKSDLKEKLAQVKKKNAASENENAVIEKVVENAQLEIPDPMVEAQIDRLVSSYANNLSNQGLTLEQYLQYTGMSMEDLRGQMRERALRNIKTSLVLEAVVKAEDISVSEERLEEELEKLAKNYKMEIEQFKEAFGKKNADDVMENLKLQEAVDFLVSEAKLV
ncbi:trigger factor tig [Johnsonella ignava ATCC 51276]|uniref:Trigger factor n=1 Tax=Johnsonella ignava ATCC 51276 TaxID=679200 RepID=G5GHG1_9FIRM|nr:trigger factor [Johnsonella ignava]EHI55958.1 trigger factor tig [Johnsonella ignava ATCC 51276]